jgi:YbgC/YbaW family acyl-CoA thioester hydrolase
MADTDAAGIIYVAAPYRWQEEIFTEWLLRCEHPLSELLASGLACPVVTSSASYLAPLRLDELVRCALAIEEIGRTSFVVRMDATSASTDVLSVQVWTRHVWTRLDDGGLRGEPFPPWLREALTRARGA